VVKEPFYVRKPDDNVKHGIPTQKYMTL